MGTRATYKFISGRNSAGPRHTVTYYIHWDGYAEGAAAYFWNMHHCANERGGLAAKFLRANDLTEFTSSHEAHGDTEYQYTITDTFLTASKRTREGGFVGFFVGSYHEFINEHSSMIEGFEPIHTFTLDDYYKRPILMTRAQCAKEVEEKQARLVDYKKSHPQFIGNIASMAADLMQWERALEGIDTRASKCA